MQVLNMKNLDSVGWWEFRRLHYNGLLLLFIGGSVVLARAIYSTAPGNPQLSWLFLAVVASIFFMVCNIAYTFNWLSEIIWTNGETDLTRPYRWHIWIFAVVSSVVLSSLLPVGTLLVSLIYRLPPP